MTLSISKTFPHRFHQYRFLHAWLLAAAALAWAAGSTLPVHGQEAPAGAETTAAPQPGAAQNTPPPAFVPQAQAPVQPSAQELDQAAQPVQAAPQQPAATPAASAPHTRADLPSHDLSPWNMFLAADIIVKGVMILLAVASVLSWSIWFGKLVQVSFATRRLQRGLIDLDREATVAQAVERRRSLAAPLAVMVSAAHDEVMRSQGGMMPAAGIKERVTSHLARIEASAGRAMTSGTGLLATIGSTAPFVGLFGTVWGIMNSFIGIAQTQTTNLAVVAPGIAEALLATGIGLVAAIPAVIFYNQLARAISGYKAKLADCGALVERMVSRDLDRQFVRTPFLKAGE